MRVRSFPGSRSRSCRGFRCRGSNGRRGSAGCPLHSRTCPSADRRAGDCCRGPCLAPCAGTRLPRSPGPHDSRRTASRPHRHRPRAARRHAPSGGPGRGEVGLPPRPAFQRRFQETRGNDTDSLPAEAPGRRRKRRRSLPRDVFSPGAAERRRGKGVRARPGLTVPLSGAHHGAARGRKERAGEGRRQAGVAPRFRTAAA